MMTLLLTTWRWPLQCEMSVNAESRVNEPLPLVMTLTNRGRPPEVLTWFTPFGWFAGCHRPHPGDGRPLAYRGPLAKRGTRRDGDFPSAGAGEQSQADAIRRRPTICRSRAATGSAIAPALAPDPGVVPLPRHRLYPVAAPQRSVVCSSHLAARRRGRPPPDSASPGG